MVFGVQFFGWPDWRVEVLQKKVGSSWVFWEENIMKKVEKEYIVTLVLIVRNFSCWLH